MAKGAKKTWSDYLWIASVLYLALGLFNILFAWLGLICFAIPLIISLSGGGKSYCNNYCGRGKLFTLLGSKYKLSRNKPMPNFFKTNWFRYGFLIFFLVMFGNMIFSTYLVFANINDLRQAVTLL